MLVITKFKGNWNSFRYNGTSSYPSFFFTMEVNGSLAGPANHFELSYYFAIS